MYMYVCTCMYAHVYICILVSYSDLFILSGTIKEILFKIYGWKEVMKFGRGHHDRSD